MTDEELFALRSRLLLGLERRVEAVADDQIAPLARRLLGLPDRAIRRHRVLELLIESCDALGYELIRWLWLASLDHDQRARSVLLDLTTSRPLVEALGYDKARRLYGRARAAEEEDIGRLFLSTPSHRAAYHDADVDENEKLAYTSLGRRKALARGQDRMVLDRLLFDRHPAVIRNLLRNPRLVERDAVRIAAMRPTAPAVIQELYRSNRWITRYPVKKAIAFNPYSPLDIAVGLLPHLARQDLRSLSRSNVVDPELKAAARRLLEVAERRWREAREERYGMRSPDDGGTE